MTQAPLSRSEDERLKCETVYALHEKGNNTNRCALGAGTSADTATRWLRNPARYHPYIDEVAVRRALNGERSVWEALTVWEFEVLYRRLNEMRRTMFDFEWNDYVEQLRKSLGHKDSKRINNAMRARAA